MPQEAIPAWPPFVQVVEPPARTQELGENVLDLLQQIVDDLPLHLIYLPERKFMSHDDICKKLRASVASMVDGARPWDAQKARIKSRIREQVEYAILSHRWLHAGEVSFQDMQTASSRPRAGPAASAKLEHFCRTAQALGCAWAWADTCCIDTAVIGELDLSFERMFRWYRDAKVCVVHLGDTRAVQDMGRAEWFCRGWTLLELLAPRRMKFYNALWKPLVEGGAFDIDRTATAAAATRNHTRTIDGPSPEEFLDKISIITKIPVQQLKHFEPGLDLVEEKMKWMESRRTVRIEDKAYCLATLFGIAMPVRYGERDNAMKRLEMTIKEEIERVHVWGEHIRRFDAA